MVTSNYLCIAILDKLLGNAKVHRQGTFRDDEMAACSRQRILRFSNDYCYKQGGN